MTTEWLEASHREGRLLSEKTYLLRPLHNLTIVLSGQAFCM